MKKRILSIIIAIVMIATYIPTVAANGNGNDNGNGNGQIHIKFEGKNASSISVNNSTEPVGKIFFDNSPNINTDYKIQNVPSYFLNKGVTHSMPLYYQNGTYVTASGKDVVVSEIIVGLEISFVSSILGNFTGYIDREMLTRRGNEPNGNSTAEFYLGMDSIKFEVGSTIKYFDGDTEIASAAGPSAIWGTSVTIDKENIDATKLPDGYEVDRENPDEITQIDSYSKNSEENIFEIYCKKVEIGSTINYYEGDTEIASAEGPSAKWGTSVSLNDDYLKAELKNGYEVAKEGIHTIEYNLDASLNIFMVYYEEIPSYQLTLNLVDIETGMLLETVDNPIVLTMKRGTEYILTGNNYLVPGFDYRGIVPAMILAAADDTGSIVSERLIPENLDINTLITDENITIPNYGLTRNLIYSRANIGYTVEHYYEDDEYIADDSFDALFQAEITADDILDYANLESGYERSKVVFPNETDSLVISATAEENIIRVYYKAIVIPEEITPELTNPPPTNTTNTSTSTPSLPVINDEENTTPLTAPAPKTTFTSIEVVENNVPLVQPSSEPTQKPTLTTIELVTEEIPKAGESAPLWPIGLALILMAGGLSRILNRKEKISSK